MKKIMIVAIILLVSRVFQSCHKIDGSGPIVSQTYAASGFTSLTAGLDADVYYTQGSSYKVEIFAQQNILDVIDAFVVNSELYVQFEKYKNVAHYSRIVVYITAPALNGLGIIGSGNIHVAQAISNGSMSFSVDGSGSVHLSEYSGDMLSASVSGSGSITIDGGTVTNEVIKISGSGDVNVVGLTAKYVTTHTSGSGTIHTQATDALDVHISGSGDVYYSGYPSVHSEISGSGKLKHL